MSEGSVVKLKVYDLSGGRTWMMGFFDDRIQGIWHTGVEVFGREFFYNSTICVCPKGDAWPGADKLSSEKVIGTTQRTHVQFEKYLWRVRNKYTPKTYDIISWNCNNFSDRALRFLIQDAGVPQEIRRVPFLIADTTVGKHFLPKIKEDMETVRKAAIESGDEALLRGDLYFYGGAQSVVGERSGAAKHISVEIGKDLPLPKFRVAETETEAVTDQTGVSETKEEGRNEKKKPGLQIGKKMMKPLRALKLTKESQQKPTEEENPDAPPAAPITASQEEPPKVPPPTVKKISFLDDLPPTFQQKAPTVSDTEKETQGTSEKATEEKKAEDTKSKEGEKEGQEASPTASRSDFLRRFSLASLSESLSEEVLRSAGIPAPSKGPNSGSEGEGVSAPLVGVPQDAHAQESKQRSEADLCASRKEGPQTITTTGNDPTGDPTKNQKQTQMLQRVDEDKADSRGQTQKIPASPPSPAQDQKSSAFRPSSSKALTLSSSSSASFPPQSSTLSGTVEVPLPPPPMRLDRNSPIAPPPSASGRHRQVKEKAPSSLSASSASSSSLSAAQKATRPHGTTALSQAHQNGDQERDPKRPSRPQASSVSSDSAVSICSGSSLNELETWAKKVSPPHLMSQHGPQAGKGDAHFSHPHHSSQKSRLTEKETEKVARPPMIQDSKREEPETVGQESRRLTDIQTEGSDSLESLNSQETYRRKSVNKIRSSSENFQEDKEFQQRREPSNITEGTSVALPTDERLETQKQRKGHEQKITKTPHRDSIWSREDQIYSQRKEEEGEENWVAGSIQPGDALQDADTNKIKRESHRFSGTSQKTSSQPSQAPPSDTAQPSASREEFKESPDGQRIGKASTTHSNERGNARMPLRRDECKEEGKYFLEEDDDLMPWGYGFSSSDTEEGVEYGQADDASEVSDGSNPSWRTPAFTPGRRPSFQVEAEVEIRKALRELRGRLASLRAERWKPGGVDAEMHRGTGTVWGGCLWEERVDEDEESAAQSQPSAVAREVSETSPPSGSFVPPRRLQQCCTECQGFPVFHSCWRSCSNASPHPCIGSDQCEEATQRVAGLAERLACIEASSPSSCPSGQNLVCETMTQSPPVDIRTCQRYCETTLGSAHVACSTATGPVPASLSSYTGLCSGQMYTATRCRCH
uniref:PPPDE domain-containing protein n=1 Tax=Chromera velia CCMP2878 TaxID=1169474 RepID=A0A0G4EZH6_9ALVE|eukprot:Cvel_14314.t1-p1 / transcript=Cvel_14314.t1 / gene=Cvel_14314 / organism=Chromera_velia_CCMP2878 / gene_product=Desumoylating isopeptidase 1, putative / transcript_product=Desumoylating isopeptidase 1, putative / location=Cvel_scaffold1012:23719-31459(+) / protein_length=1152 / sequence_SO=supercontig / SO=protein_coding / is_pseudo=false